MASTSEIRRRITSVRETQKITHAMYLISQAKLRRARQDLDDTRPYFNALQTEIKRIFRVDSTVESPYFSPESTSELDYGTYGILSITADKGLAGAYNQNVLRQTQASCSPLSISGASAPGSLESGSNLPQSRFFATPMVGTSTNKPKWLATPRRRGCEIP